MVYTHTKKHQNTHEGFNVHLIPVGSLAARTICVARTVCNGSWVMKQFAKAMYHIGQYEYYTHICNKNGATHTHTHTGL